MTLAPVPVWDIDLPVVEVRAASTPELLEITSLRPLAANLGTLYQVDDSNRYILEFWDGESSQFVDFEVAQ